MSIHVIWNKINKEKTTKTIENITSSRISSIEDIVHTELRTWKKKQNFRNIGKDELIKVKIETETGRSFTTAKTKWTEVNLKKQNTKLWQLEWTLDILLEY